MAGQGYTAIQQAQTIGDSAAPWSQSLDFAQFDPSLGTLLDINVGLTGDLAGSIAIENLEAAPAVFSVALAGRISVFGPAGSSLAGATLATVTPQATGTITLGAFDGTLDYAGSSGATLGGLGNSGTQDIVLQAGSVGSSGVVGTGSVALPVTASSTLHVTGPANMQILSQASAGAVVTLDYSYGTASSGSESSSGSVFTAIFIGSLPLANSGTVFLPDNDLQTTAVQTLGVADATTGWTNDVAAQQFDPALGTLATVNLTVANDILASVSAANLEAAAGSIATTQTATVTLDAPGATLSADAAVSSDASLPAYAGSSSFTGSSGVIEQGLTAGPGAGGWYAGGSATAAGDLAAYVGAGSVDLPLVSSSTATLDGPGNLLARLQAESGATVTVSYTYQPVPVLADAGNSVSSVPGSTVVADSGLRLSEAGTQWLTGATVAITGGLLPGDVLSADTALAGSNSGTTAVVVGNAVYPVGISASYDTADGTLTLSGAATAAAYQQVLQSVAFSSGAADPTAGGSDTSRTLTWTATDAYGAGAAPVSSTIAVQMPATFTSSGTEDVTIAQPGTYTVASLQSAHAVVLDSPGATLVLDATLDVTAGFTLEAGTLTLDGGTLSAGWIDMTGGAIGGSSGVIAAAGNVDIGGGSVDLGSGMTMEVGIAPGLVGLGDPAASTGLVVPTGSSGFEDEGADTVSTGIAPVLLVPTPPSPVVTPAPSVQPVNNALPQAGAYPGAVTAEALGLAPLLLAAASGAGPAAPDVWQMMTQADISAASGMLDVLLNPADQRWVALRVPDGAPLPDGAVAGGGPLGALGQFLADQQNHPPLPGMAPGDW